MGLERCVFCHGTGLVPTLVPAWLGCPGKSQYFNPSEKTRQIPVPDGYYQQILSSSSYEPEECKSCRGKGYVIIYKSTNPDPTKDEIAEFYTCELAGEPVRAYEELRNQIVTGICLVFSDGLKYWLLPGHPNQARALLEAAHIPIMSFEESQKYGGFEPPKAKEE